MKYINPSSERYIKRINELEARCHDLDEKNRALQKENNVLRVTHLSRKSTTRTTGPDTGSILRSPCTPRFAASTASSRGTANVEPEKVVAAVCNADESRVVTIRNKKYTYMHGVPTPVLRKEEAEPEWLRVQSYMKATGASSQRYSQIQAEIEARAIKAACQTRRKPARRTEESESSTWGSEWGSAACVSSGDFSWGEPTTSLSMFTPTPPFSPSIDEDEQVDKFENNSGEFLQEPQLDELVADIQVVKTGSEANFSYLKRAHIIAKESVWAALMAGNLGPRELENYKDGPDLIAFGFAELQTLLGSVSLPCMANNGYSASTVYSTIFDVRPLRNMVCHENSEELRDPFETDDRLKRALRVAIVLGNEKGADELRDIRKSLQSDVQAVCDWLKDLHSLVASPGYEADWDLQPHQEAMLRRILRNWEHLKARGDDLEDFRAVYEVALAWLNWVSEEGVLLSNDEFYDVSQEVSW